jgi:hypothetical protein
MSFFEPPEVPPEPPVERQNPVWLGPPENELGVAVPLRELLVRTDDLAIALLGVVAYSNGLQLQVELRRRTEADDTDVMHLHMRRRHARGPEIAPEVLRFGVQFADGRKATNVGGRPWGLDDQPAGPLLMERGGGGGGRTWSFGYWLWPLPPAGALTVAVEWPAQNVPLTTRELDTAPLREAAARSEALWPEGGRAGGGGSSWQISRMTRRS